MQFVTKMAVLQDLNQQQSDLVSRFAVIRYVANTYFT